MFYQCVKMGTIVWRVQGISTFGVHQHFTEVFNIDDVTTNDVIQRNQHHKELNLSSIVITDVKLALWLKKDSEFSFSFFWQEHYYNKISGAWLCVYVRITVLF